MVLRVSRIYSSYIRGGKRAAVAGSENAATLTSLHFGWRFKERLGAGMTLCDLTKDMTTGKSMYTKFYDLSLVHGIGLL